MGRYVAVYSEIGIGTTFKIFLPATAEVSSKAEEERDSAQRPARLRDRALGGGRAREEHWYIGSLMQLDTTLFRQLTAKTPWKSCGDRQRPSTSC